jgi:hypothetical protein
MNAGLAQKRTSGNNDKPFALTLTSLSKAPTQKTIQQEVVPMPYVALEWDHKIARPVIKWLVVKCQSVGWKFGGPQAMAPRRDIAYFVDDATAERDAKAFAAYKTRQEEAGPEAEKLGGGETYSNRHAAFNWDHNIFNPLVQWAVLEWNGSNPDGVSVRNDVAYFLDPEHGEADARAFRVIRDQLIAGETFAEVTEAVVA